MHCAWRCRSAASSALRCLFWRLSPCRGMEAQRGSHNARVRLSSPTDLWTVSTASLAVLYDSSRISHLRPDATALASHDLYMSKTIVSGHSSQGHDAGVRGMASGVFCFCGTATSSVTMSARSLRPYFTPDVCCIPILAIIWLAKPWVAWKILQQYGSNARPFLLKAGNNALAALPFSKLMEGVEWACMTGSSSSRGTVAAGLRSLSNFFCAEHKKHLN